MRSSIETLFKLQVKNQVRMLYPRTFCDYQEEMGIEWYQRSSEQLEKYFYSIFGTINYTTQHFIMYHIKVNRILNSQSFSFDNDEKFVRFEYTVKNLPTRVTWCYYVNDLNSPEHKVMDLNIDKISLTGNINKINGVLNFAQSSHVSLSSKEGRLIRNYFSDRLQPIILKSFQKLILNEFERILRNLQINNGDVAQSNDEGAPIWF